MSKNTAFYDTMATLAKVDPNGVEAAEAAKFTSEAIENVIREGVWPGDIYSWIFDEVSAPMGYYDAVIDPIRPGDEYMYSAWVAPNTGYVAERDVTSDYVMVPTFRIDNSADMTIEFAEQNNKRAVDKFVSSLQAGFVMKKNMDAWYTLLNAGASRNALVTDADADPGQFTKRLVSSMQSYMKRNAGGNGMSLTKGKLTHLAVSVEAKEEIRNWGLDQIDEITRRSIYIGSEDSADLTRIMGTIIVEMTELGEGSIFQAYWDNVIGASMGASDVEIVVGLDLSTRGTADHPFINPIHRPISIYDDMTMLRRGKIGKWGYTKLGWAALDSRKVLIGSF